MPHVLRDHGPAGRLMDGHSLGSRRTVSSFQPSTIPSFSIEEKEAFRPRPANDFVTAGLNSAQIEGLVLKFLLNFGNASGRRVADELGLPFGPFPEFLRHLKNQQIVAYTDNA